MECMYPAFTSMPHGVTVGDSGFCCCVPGLSRAINHFGVGLLSITALLVSPLRTEQVLLGRHILDGPRHLCKVGCTVVVKLYKL